MAYIYGLGEVVASIEVLLEGKDIAETVKVASHAFDAAFLPGPKLGGDIMDIE
jgi:hypothetical protein